MNRESRLAHGIWATTTRCCLQYARSAYCLELRERGHKVEGPRASASLPASSRAAPTADPAATLLPRPRPDRHDDRAEHAHTRAPPLDPEQHPPYASGAHAATAFLFVPDLRSRNRGRVARRALPAARRPGASSAQTSPAYTADGGRESSSTNHARTSRERCPPSRRCLIGRRRSRDLRVRTLTSRPEQHKRL
jgi:hypothetical protein